MGDSQTADDLARVEWVLRSATRTALRRRSVTGDHADQLARDAGTGERNGMRRSPIMVREIYYDAGCLPRGSGLGGVDVGDVDDLNLDDEDLDDREDHDHDRERDKRNANEEQR